MTRLPKRSFWGVWRGHLTAGYKVLLWGGRYKWGCRGNSLHHGIDSGSYTGAPIYALGHGIVMFTRYGGAYRRFVQIYYPKARMTETVGHLLNRGYVRAGQRVRRGQRIGYVGTVYDGVNHRHAHRRAAYGRWRYKWIPACADVHPIILWRRLFR